MSAILQVSLALVIIISAAKTAGYLSARFGQPAVLGELLAGLLLGPTVLDLIHWPMFSYENLGETIKVMAELGVIFLMFIAGLEVNVGQLRQARKVAALAGTLGVVVPVLMGWGAAALFGFEPKIGLYIGLILAATSVSISAQTLMELRVLRSREGVALLGAAVFDDVLVILFLSLFIAFAIGTGGAGLAGVALVVIRIGLYFGLATLLGLYLFPRLTERVTQLPISQGLMATVLVTAMLYAWAAEVWGGIAAITGAFLAGLLLGRTHFRERIEAGMHTLAYSLFVPVFFVNIGLEVNARELVGAGAGSFVITICLVAILSKIVGSGLGARLGGFSNREALRLGIGMVSRGEVGLIVASVGLAEGLIGTDTFAATVVMVIVSTLVTPPLMRAVFPRPGLQPASRVAERSDGIPSEGE